MLKGSLKDTRIPRRPRTSMGTVIVFSGKSAHVLTCCNEFHNQHKLTFFLLPTNIGILKWVCI